MSVMIFTVKLNDFGFPPAELRGEAKVNSPYHAPEVLDGLAGKDLRKADVFSLGVILYEMMHGAPPKDLSKWQIYGLFYCWLVSLNLSVSEPSSEHPLTYLCENI